VEHDPLEILYSEFRAIADVLAKSSVSPSDIACIGIANQRETTVVWEKATGRPVYNAIVWQCRRTAPICESLIKGGLDPVVGKKTGLLIDAYFSAPKIKWILDNVTGARAKAERGELLFGTVDTWLIWNLTGGAVHATDVSNASRTMLFDIDRLCWDEELYRALNVPMCMLPEVKPSSAVYGKVAKGILGIEQLFGVPICGVAGDQQAALFGQTCFEPGSAKNTYGTGCFLMMNIGDKSIRSRNRLLTTVAWSAEGKVEYALEGSVFNAGSVIKWLRDDLKLIESAPQCDELAESVPDTGGVYFVPAFTGLGAPYWDMYARGTMVGLTRGTGRAHIARSVLESIAFQVKDLVHAMENDSGHKMTELRVDGGASASDVMMRFQADMLPARVIRPQNVETTALGAAYLAGLCAGLWNSRSELAARVPHGIAFSPNMSEERRSALYAGWKRAVERAKGWER
jgi:glycerol kinase